MSANISRWGFALLVLILVVVVASLGEGTSRGVPADPPAGGGNGAKAKLKPYYFGKQACFQNCHNLPKDKPREDKEFPPLCRCTEATIWDTEDKHGQAHEVLKDKDAKGEETRAGQMGRLLKIVPTKAPQCLSCHAVNVEKDAEVDPTFHIEEGVNCGVCHGHHQEYVPLHYNPLPGPRKKWRDMPRETKEDTYGMKDLWNPLKRAELCASCHIGDGKTKMVTHEMYAAGHPPLPSFEAATFSNQMPRHWQYLREKRPEVQAILKYDGKELEHTKLLLVGAAVSLKASAHMLAEKAREAAQANEVIDFACFDCYACHHDLKSPSLRQKRGFAGKAGRMSLPYWPQALIPLARSHAGEDNVGPVTAVTKEFDLSPFGDPKSIAKSADALDEWASKLAEKIVSLPCEKKNSEQLYKELTEMAGKSTLDYDSARQVAWALKTLYSESKDKSEADADTAFQPFDPASGAKMYLKLPAGKDRQIMNFLGSGLEARNQYDPEEFMKALGKVPR
jgi:hypothetical protein